MSQFIEAFKELEGLDELEDNVAKNSNGLFTLDKKGMDDLYDFLQADEDDTVEEEEDMEEVTLIDPEARTTADLKKNYKGYVVCRCEICGEEILKKVDDLIVDEDTGLVNPEEECPNCGIAYGYKIVGEMANDNDDAEADDEAPGLEIEDDDLDNLFDDTADIESTYDNADDEAPEFKEEVNIDDLVFDDEFEDFEPMTESLDNILLKDSASDKTVELDLSDEESIGVTVKKDDKDPGTTVGIKTNSEFDDTSDIDTEEEGDEEGWEDEFAGEEEEDENGNSIEEVSDETINEIEANTEEAEEEENEEEEEEEGEEVEVGEIEEESFDRLNKKYLRRVYENVDDYRTVASYKSNNSMVLEGLITFNSGKVSPTVYVFTSDSVDRHNRYKFLGENLQISQNKKAFAMKGRMVGEKFIPESLTYSYNQRDPETGGMDKLYGTIR